MFNKKKFIIILLIFALVGIGIYFVFYQRSNLGINLGNKQNIENKVMAGTNIDRKKVIDAFKGKDFVTDTDHDGLADEQEKKIGTDPNKRDTDGDGLPDGYEVLISHTDPLKADTDGDGFSDAVEINSGYNPLGPGKLSK